MTTIKVHCPNCGEYELAGTVIISSNAITAECFKCGQTVTIWGKREDEV